MKKTSVCHECRRMKPSVLNVDEDAVDRLRQVRDARAAAAWNFDFQRSTPLPGRYDWQRLPDHVVVGVQEGPTADPNLVNICRERPLSTLGRTSARRRLVFDNHDLAAADKAISSFLLSRLISPHRCPDTQDRSERSPQMREGPHRSELMCQTTLTSSDVVSFGYSQQRQEILSSNDAANFSVQFSSSTRRRSATKRTRSARENPSFKVSKITGKP